MFLHPRVLLGDAYETSIRWKRPAFRKVDIFSGGADKLVIFIIDDTVAENWAKN